MDNYFNSYIGKARHHKYIVPTITIISNGTSRSNLVAHTNDDDNPINMDAYRAIPKFNPYLYRVSHPIALNSFVIGPDNLFYEVTEGIYCVEDGINTLKLKVKKQYG